MSFPDAKAVDHLPGSCRPLAGARSLTLSVVCLALAGPIPAVAAEWYVDPAIDTRVEYDDNFRLRNDELEVLGLRVEPRVEVGANAERWRFDVDTRVEFRSYDEEEFDSDNQAVELSSAWGRQTWGVGFDAGYIRDSTTTSEIETTGIVVAASRREQLYARPTLTLQPSEVNQFAFGASVRGTRYASDNFNDYDYNAVDFTWTRTLSPQMSLQVAPYFTRFTSDVLVLDSDFGTAAEAERQSDTLGLTVGLSRSYNERWQIDGVVGSSRVSTDRPITDFDNCLEPNFIFCQRYAIAEDTDENTGFVGEIGARYRGERWRYGGRVSRSYTPSGNSFLIVQDRLEADADYLFTERLRGIVRITGLAGESVEEEVGFNRDFYRIAVGLNFRIANNLTVVGLLSHRSQERQEDRVTGFTPDGAPIVEEVTVVDADANSVFVEFRYDFNRHTWSR